jgi:hypothetical protein
LQPAIAEGFIDGNDNFVSCEFVEDGSKEVHACVFPESALVVEYLMPHDVSDSGEFVVGAVGVEVDECAYEVVGEGEVIAGDVFFSPEFDLVVGVDHLGFAVEVLFGGWELVGA